MERNQSFHWSDYLVFVFWLMIYSLVGIYHRYRSQINNFARRVLRRNTPQDKFQKSEVDDLFLSNRQLSLLPVVSSLMASFLSAVSLLGTTAESYLSGLQFICMIFAYFISFSITSEVYMPVFYKLRLSCAHEYLELRFGKTVRFGASVMFCLQMWVYIALALYAPALALSQVSGLPTWLSIVSTGTVATFYTALGGIRAVVWTDAVQLLVLTIGLLLIAILGIMQVGGIGQLWAVALEGKRLNSFSFDPNPFLRHTVWSLAFGGSGMVMSIFATNQTQVQRYLACRDILTARRAILLNIPFNTVFLAVQLLCGLVVYANFVGCDPLRAGQISRHDQLLPYFVMLIFENTPVIRGLFLSVIFAAALSLFLHPALLMLSFPCITTATSTVSSGVNSLANVWIEDLILPWLKIACGKSIRPRNKSFLAMALCELYSAIKLLNSISCLRNPFICCTLDV
ncbi:Sodium-coupled monocarboxylate transporter [Fasciolopsis buskii]|uniref:Sodium-coupled monocarboxylate transporter n=1 Tax=Fasciolopsis buskii TaxID=27845 RepID=A0A8E0VH00_9TREM|nr:Sodium-coupled monocarboxylate transporter [Fasciolopsis buski]